MSLIRIVREGKDDADLFIGKRYIQLVNFITELLGVFVFEFWVLRFRDRVFVFEIGSSFSRFGVFVFEI